MIREAEEFAAQDEAHKKRVETLNSFSNTAYNLKSQVADASGFGGKVGYWGGMHVARADASPAKRR